MTGRDLDHVGVAVDDLATAAAAFRRLGFAPAPLGFHVKRRDDGTLYRSGTGNHCLIFKTGFVELLGVTDAAVHPGWLPTYLDRYRGLHILGFGSADIGKDAAQMRAIEPSIATRQLYQTIGEEEGAPFADFGVIDIPRNHIPECHVVALEHRTRDLFFDPDWTEHPNSAVALVSAGLLAAEPGDLALRLARLFGCAIEEHSSGAHVLTGLAGGRVEIMDAPEMARLYPGLVAPTTPWMASFGVSVRDMGKTAALLRGQSINMRALDDGSIMVDPENACGAAVIFEQAR